MTVEPRAVLAGPGAARALHAGGAGRLEVALGAAGYVLLGADGWLLLTGPRSALGPLSLLVVGSWILGAIALQDFAVALLVGLVTGSYSSIFIATPILAMLKRREPKWRAVQQRAARNTDVATPAVASAPAMVPIDSLERCMGCLLAQNIEADGSGLRPLGPDTMPHGLLGVFRHQPLELGLGALVLQKGRPGPAEHPGHLGPGI